MNIPYEEDNHSADDFDIPPPDRKPSIQEAIDRQIEEKNARFFSDMRSRFREFANHEIKFSEESKKLANTLRKLNLSSLLPREKTLFLKAISSYETIANETNHFPEITEDTLSSLENMMAIYSHVNQRLSSSKNNQAFKERACSCLWFLINLEELQPLFNKLLHSHPKKVEILQLLPTPFQNTARLKLFSTEFLKSIDKQFNGETKQYFAIQIKDLENLHAKSQLVSQLANLMLTKIEKLKKNEVEKLNLIKSVQLIKDGIKKIKLIKDEKQNPPLIHQDKLEKVIDELISTAVTLVLEVNLEPQKILMMTEEKINCAIDITLKKSVYPNRTCDVFYNYLIHYFSNINQDRADDLNDLIKRIKIIRNSDNSEKNKLNLIKSEITNKISFLANHWRIITVRNCQFQKDLEFLELTMQHFTIGEGHSFYCLSAPPTPDNLHVFFTEWKTEQENTLCEYALNNRQLYEIDKEQGKCTLIATLSKNSYDNLTATLNIKESISIEEKKSQRVIEKLSPEQVNIINDIVIQQKIENEKKTQQIYLPFISELGSELKSTKSRSQNMNSENHDNDKHENVIIDNGPK